MMKEYLQDSNDVKLRLLEISPGSVTGAQQFDFLAVF